MIGWLLAGGFVAVAGLVVWSLCAAASDADDRFEEMANDEVARRRRERDR